MRTSKTVLVRALFLVVLYPFAYPAMAQLKAGFTASPLSGCAPLVVNFTNTSQGNPGLFKWDLGNGVTSTETNPTTSYFDAGVYTVKLVIYSGNQSDSVVRTSFITVYQNPVAAFSISDSTGCFPLNVNYTDKSNPGSGTIASRTWDFGDGNVSTQQQPSHTYTSSGLFSISLSVTNSYGCVASVSRNSAIHIGHGVHSDYSANAGPICHPPATFNFSSSASGDSIKSYAWNFGDGTVSAQSTPSHIYNKTGSYQVSLKVTSINGCSDIITKAIPVSFVNSSININDTICANGKVQFINTSVPAPVSSQWSFGDNTVSNDVSPYKTFSSPGSFTIKVVNTFFAGCVDSTEKNEIVVSGVAPSFQTNDTSGCSLPFNANFKNTTAGTGLSYVWNFGDGTKSYDVNPQHQYTKYGNYNVVLSVTNGGGCVQQVLKTSAIIVQPVKITGISGLAAGCVPYAVKPSLQTNIPVAIQKYSWDFGDGFVSNDASPSHTYTAEGIYKVKIKIETAAGCVDSLTVADSVGHKLHPTFTIDPASSCASQEIAFNNTTQQASSFLWWYLGDGTIVYKQPNPSHNYLDTGYFDVMLVVSDNGCLDTLIKKHSVHIAGPIARFNTLHNCNSKMTLGVVNRSTDDKTRIWDFGDGSTDTSKSPVHVYAATGNYDVKLFVSNGKCNYTVDSIIRIVNEKPVFNITDTAACRNAQLNFALSNVNPENISNVFWRFAWSLVNQTNKTFVTTSYSFVGNGNFTPTATVTDILGCVDTLRASHSITIYGPTARFTALQTGACTDGIIHFKDGSYSDGIHPITSWAVDYGNNNKVGYNTNQDFFSQYKDTGMYTVALTATDSYGCADVYKLSNAVHITRPHAAFNLSDSIACPRKQLVFNNTSTGVGLKYSWNLGDGTTSTAASPNHLFGAEGVFMPSLVVTDINNCKDSATYAWGVHVFRPSAHFALSDSFSTCPPLPVNFSSASVNYASLQWNFGDGNSSTLVSPEHIYTYPGVYTVQLIANGNGACADSITKTVTVKGPTGTLDYAKNPVCYPSTQRFTATSQTAVQYLWDYSDGQTNLSSVDTSSHNYAPGFYLPKLILIDNAGCKVPIKGIDTLKIYDIKVNGGATNAVLCDSGKVTFNDSSVTNDVIASHTWVFSDNSMATGAQVSHLFAAPGSYSVTLVDVTANGCKGSTKLNVPVKIVQSPAISIAGVTSYCAPGVVSLQGRNSSLDTSTVTWNWNFGNGITTNIQNPSGIVLPGAGSYNVTASATGGNGCTGTASAVVNIHAIPAVKINANTAICRAGSTSLTVTGASSYVWNDAPGISCTECSSPVAKPDSTTTYTVTGKDDYGCFASDSVTVSVSQPVHVSISNNDTLCNGETKQLKASGAAAYQWFPAVYLSDATVAQPTFQAVRDTAITYNVIGYDAKRCFTDTATIKVKVYPIPQMKVGQSTVSAESGGKVELSAISSPDVTKWKWSPAIWLDNPNIANPVAQPRESITYTVVAANDGACVTRAQVAVTVVCNGSNIFVPNTFSPNGDGINEKFYPQGKDLYNIKSFRVFNRWGQIVFERMNISANNPADGWDGTFKGQKLAADVYVYMIEVLCKSNTVVPVKGNVTLLR